MGASAICPVSLVGAASPETLPDLAMNWWMTVGRTLVGASSRSRSTRSSTPDCSPPASPSGYSNAPSRASAVRTKPPPLPTVPRNGGPERFEPTRPPIACPSEQRDGVRERREQHEEHEHEGDDLLAIHTNVCVFGKV
jgi:hypothetical protein